MNGAGPEKTEPPPTVSEAVPIPYAASGSGLHGELYSIPSRSQPSGQFVEALARGLAKERLQRFRATYGGDTVRAVQLYQLDQALSAGLMSVLATAECLVRESMHQALTAGLGHRWFDQDEFFDYRTREGITRGKWTVGRPHSWPKLPPGKIIAAFSFGVWCDLLARGSVPEKNSKKPKLDYEQTLWYPHLRAAFPAWELGRADLDALVRRVKYARNRVAHHEPLVFGVPLPGVLVNGTQTRLRPATVAADVLSLIGAVDRDAAAELRTVIDAWPVLADERLLDAEKYARHSFELT